MDRIENEYVKIFLREDGIIHAAYQPNLVIDMPVAKITVESRLKVSNGITRPLLADIRNLKRVEDEAREYLGNDDAYGLIKALAILTNTPIQNLFANFYLRFKSSPCPTKLFTDKNQALRWLALHNVEQLN